MGGLFGGRNLKRLHAATLRVHGAHDVLDSAVLAAGIHRLQTDQERPLVLRVHQILQAAQLLAVGYDFAPGGRLVFMRGVEMGIDVRKLDPMPGFDVEFLTVMYDDFGRRPLNGRRPAGRAFSTSFGAGIAVVKRCLLDEFCVRAY